MLLIKMKTGCVDYHPILSLVQEALTHIDIDNSPYTMRKKAFEGL